MGYEAKKTEHCGPKRGAGAYWGYKWEAKKESKRIRRENWRRGCLVLHCHSRRASRYWTFRLPQVGQATASMLPHRARAMYAMHTSGSEK